MSKVICGNSLSERKTLLTLLLAAVTVNDATNSLAVSSWTDHLFSRDHKSSSSYCCKWVKHLCL